jgi:hypothetical protein
MKRSTVIAITIIVAMVCVVILALAFVLGRAKSVLQP